MKLPSESRLLRQRVVLRGWRGVASSLFNAASTPRHHTLQVDLQSVRDSVKYCCFLLDAEVTDSALLALSKEILFDKVRGERQIQTEITGIRCRRSFLPLSGLRRVVGVYEQRVVSGQTPDTSRRPIFLLFSYLVKRELPALARSEMYLPPSDAIFVAELYFPCVRSFTCVFYFGLYLVPKRRILRPRARCRWARSASSCRKPRPTPPSARP